MVSVKANRTDTCKATDDGGLNDKAPYWQSDLESSYLGSLPFVNRNKGNESV